MKRLRTVQQVVDVLGGLDGICELSESPDWDVNLKQAWHWVGRAGQFPANTYVVMTRALHRRGYEAPARLWSMKGVSEAA
jgi:hypothetical protein